MKFKRGIVISSEHKVEEVTRCPSQELIIRDSEGREYQVTWTCFGTSYNDFFGEGDKVSFLYDENYDRIVRIRLNPFYKE